MFDIHLTVLCLRHEAAGPEQGRLDWVEGKVSDAYIWEGKSARNIVHSIRSSQLAVMFVQPVAGSVAGPGAPLHLVQDGAGGAGTDWDDGVCRCEARFGQLGHGLLGWLHVQSRKSVGSTGRTLPL